MHVHVLIYMYSMRLARHLTLLARAMMTVPRLLRLLLMLLVSLRRSPAEPDWESLSEPARSIRFRVPA